jgi:hypothetical protein
LSQGWNRGGRCRNLEGLPIEGTAGSTTAVVWIEDGIYCNVAGPADSFSADRATSVANTVIAAAS